MLSDRALNAFLRQYLDDLASGRRRTVGEYQALFPGHEEVVADQYARYERVDASTQPTLEHIGRFRIVRELGRGGQGVVYLAEDDQLHRRVAIKVLTGLGTLSPDRIARFLREAELASRLVHPGIATVYEVGMDAGVPFIAMRYVEGTSIASQISNACPSGGHANARSFVDLDHSAGESEVREPGHPAHTTSPGPRTSSEIAKLLQLFEAAARALHFAHEAGVVHRDVKPGNIMVCRDGTPVLLDFGLAQDLEGGQPTLTGTGELMGTPAYMSPEQIACRRVRVDRRTDVYSLGVSLYECLTLRRPFEAPTRESLYQAILSKDPPNIRSLNPAVPKDLRVVVETALEKDRDRRYQTALDFAEELRRIHMHEPIVAKPVGQLLRLRRWSQRNPALATATAGLFFVLVTGLTTALVLLGKSERERLAKEKALGEVTIERDAKNTALTEKTGALEDRNAALAEYLRLGDLSRIESLKTEADTLWPAELSKTAAMKRWLNQGSDLEKRLASHTAARDRLRTSAGLRPYTDVDREADLKSHHAERERLAKLQGEREKTAASLAAAESRAASRPPESTSTAISGPDSWASSRLSPADLRTALVKLDAEIQGLDVLIHERLTWKFESSAEQFKHDTTAKLVADLTTLVGDPKKSLLAEIRSRLSFAETVERETIGKYETQWVDSIRSIADPNECPMYNGLRIEPQLGLIPIGKDPASGLWEFAHLQTTAPGADPIPKRDKNGRLIVTESMGLVFVLLPGGVFRMGAIRPDEDQAHSDPNIDPEAMIEESPVTEVHLDPFFLSKYEMTQGQWQRLVGRNPSTNSPGTKFGDKVVDLRNPVEQVSADDCDLWLGRLRLILPTEAQWEYAARGGTTTPRWTGIGTKGLRQAANLADESLRQDGGSPNWNYEAWNDGYSVHAPVGSFAPNPFGLHDVLGNLWEWCRDYLGGYDLSARQGDGLRSPSAVRGRVFRGGGFSFVASLARSAIRTADAPDRHGEHLGVRPARSVSIH